ncbi:MAG: SpoVA/SpoVAEb family sporulation membrane protein [Clostridia bacterium]|nr:SpoVA/SpoVAEb family sporulation membrane protein [Clostridia bacterium]
MIITDIILAAVSGGIICALAQLLIDLTKLTPARILVLYVTLGVLIYALGLYEPLYSLFGAGVSLPLIGFGANIGRGVYEAVTNEGAIGILSGGMTSSSAGITLALVMGLTTALIFKSKSKRM